MVTCFLHLKKKGIVKKTFLPSHSKPILVLQQQCNETWYILSSQVGYVE
jgi:hypothetical protein